MGMGPTHHGEQGRKKVSWEMVRDTAEAGRDMEHRVLYGIKE